MYRAIILINFHFPLFYEAASIKIDAAFIVPGFATHLRESWYNIAEEQQKGFAEQKHRRARNNAS